MLQIIGLLFVEFCIYQKLLSLFRFLTSIAYFPIQISLKAAHFNSFSVIGLQFTTQAPVYQKSSVQALH